MASDTSIILTSEFGLIIRRSALAERHVDLRDLMTVLGANERLDGSDDLLSFGPHFGREALNTMISQLTALGLIYFDDFFEFCGDYPRWFVFRGVYLASSQL